MVDLSKCICSVSDVRKDYYLIIRYGNKYVEYVEHRRLTGYGIIPYALVSNKIDINFKHKKIKIHVKQ